MGIPSLSAKEEVILRMLVSQGGKELYGLEMVQHSEKRLKPGTIYVTLSRMEDKGYIQSRKEEPRPSARGLPRRLYKVTGLGQKVLSAWELANEQFAGGGI